MVIALVYTGHTVLSSSRRNSGNIHVAKAALHWASPPNEFARSCARRHHKGSCENLIHKAYVRLRFRTLLTELRGRSEIVCAPNEKTDATRLQAKMLPIFGILVFLRNLAPIRLRQLLETTFSVITNQRTTPPTNIANLAAAHP